LFVIKKEVQKRCVEFIWCLVPKGMGRGEIFFFNVGMFHFIMKCRIGLAKTYLKGLFYNKQRVGK